MSISNPNNLHNHFKRGLYKALAYYAAGLLIAWTTYLIAGWEYKHASGLHHLIGFLFLAGGALWIGYSLLLLLTGLRPKVNLGALTIHSAVVVAFILYLAISINNDSISDEVNDQADILTISEDTLTHTSSVVNGLGDTLFLKVKDSVLKDKLTAPPATNH